MANVAPLFKKGIVGESGPGNYRAVVLVSVALKVLEQNGQTEKMLRSKWEKDKCNMV